MRSIFLVLLAMTIVPAVAASQECLDYGDYRHWVTALRTPGPPCGVAIFGDFAYVADGGLRVVDITDPATPGLVGGVDGQGARIVVVSGGYAYTNGGGGFQVFDVTDPMQPLLAGGVDTPGGAPDLVVSGGYAYVADGDAGLQVIVLGDPAAPRLIGNVDTPGSCDRVAASGNIACVADGGSGLQVIDITDPANPLLLGGWDPGLYYFEVTDVDILGNLVYVGVQAGVGWGGGGLYVLDITNPASPQRVGGGGPFDDVGDVLMVTISGGNLYARAERWSGPWFEVSESLSMRNLSNPADPQYVRTIPVYWALDVATVGDYVYVTSSSGLDVFNVTNPTSPPRVGYVNPRDQVRGMAASGHYVYVAIGSAGLEVFDVADPEMPVSVNLPQSPSEYNAYDVAATGNHAYVAGGDFHVIDMADPASPERMAGADTPGNATKVAILGNHAFVLDSRSDGGESGLRVVDITDPAAPRVVGGVDTPGLGQGMAIAKEHAYVAADSLGLQVIDIADPTDLRIVGGVDTPGAALDVAVRGDYAYVADAGGGLQVIEITDSTAPRIVGDMLPRSRTLRVAISGNSAYLADGSDGLQVVDLTNPASPRLVGQMGMPGGIDDVAVLGNCVYVASQFFDSDDLVYVHHLTLASLQCDTAELEVAIDIKPGNDQNPINCKSKPGVIPVAVLTTDTFDALSIDHTTVRFGPGGAAEFHVFKGPEPRGNGASSSRPVSGAPRRHEKDVDHDGDLDLLFHFARDEAGIRCGDTEVVLTGQTYDGQSIVGTDAIRTVPGGDPDAEPDGPLQISPNPFNPLTSISFVVREPQHVKVGVYDVRGRLVAELANESYPAGRHEVEWRGRDTAGRTMSSGTYFFRVDLGGRVDVRKALLVK